MSELNEDALISVDAAMRAIRKTNPTEDEKIEAAAAINAYSRAIHKYTRRQFLPKETGIAKRFEYDGSGVLNFTRERTELRGSPTEILLGSDLPLADQRVLLALTETTEAEYKLQPPHLTDEGTYLWIKGLPKLSRTVELKITGDWGAETIPSDVELACRIAVSNYLRSPEGFGSRKLGALEISDVLEAAAASDNGRSLPPDARYLLRDYRQVALN